MIRLLLWWYEAHVNHAHWHRGYLYSMHFCWYFEGFGWSGKKPEGWD